MVAVTIHGLAVEAPVVALLRSLDFIEVKWAGKEGVGTHVPFNVL